jgi:hypothetical protein
MLTRQYCEWISEHFVLDIIEVIERDYLPDSKVFRPFVGGNKDISIPLELLGHAVTTGMIGELRTFVAIKYTQAGGSGRFELDVAELARLLEVSDQTVRNHVQHLEAVGWLNRAEGRCWYVRGWDRVVKGLQMGKDTASKKGVKSFVVAKTGLNVIGGKMQFKAFALYCALYTNAVQQSHRERKRQKRKTATREAILPSVYVSCKTVASWFGVSERMGSVYRRIMADFGLFGMVRRWESLPRETGLLRAYEEAGRILLFLRSGEVWSPLCSMLHGLDTSLVNTSKRYAK